MTVYRAPTKLALIARNTPRVGRWLLVAFALLFCVQVQAGVYLMSPGKWRDGAIVWRYNPAGLEPGTDEAAVIDTVTRAFKAWSDVCNIAVQYGGRTTTGLDQTSAKHEVVVGYYPHPYPIAADAAPDSEDAASNYTYFTSGKIRISRSIGAAIQYNPNTLVHEIGHLLGIDHSDEPYSVMYANPYNRVPDPGAYQLFGDDVNTCANLYGSKGMLPATLQVSPVAVPEVVQSPKLELAAIIEQDANGLGALRLVNISPVGIDFFNAYLNGNYARNVKTYSIPSGINTLELWAKSTQVRYATDLSHNIGGQTPNSHDLVRHIGFSAVDGRVHGNRLGVSEAGSWAAYSATATVQSDQPTRIGVYVAAVFGNTVFFRQSGGWGNAAAPLFTMTGPAAASVDVLRDFDARGLPAGLALFIGFGATLEDMLSRGQYQLVRSF